MENRTITLLEKLPKTKGKEQRGIFRCFCGKEFVSYLRSISRGYKKSCGCVRKESFPTCPPPEFIRLLPKVKFEAQLAVYKCFCGNEFTAKTKLVTSGSRKSCGCFTKQKSSTAKKEDPFTLRLKSIWRAMIYRTTKATCKYYPIYGGRGITVCDEWKNNFVAFRDWALENGYEIHLTIDRKNVDGNYEPDNCRWATKKEQTFNRRAFGGVSKYKGVDYDNSMKRKKRWRARIKTPEGKRLAIGNFETEKEAALAYNEAAKKYHGEFAVLNIIDED